MRNKPVQVIVHHSAATVPNPQFDAINEWHKVREFPLSEMGWFVGYHYVIEKDGAILRARGDSEEGAHTIGQNTASLGVCLVGNFDVEMPTKAQVDSLGVLLYDLCKEYEIPDERIVPHRRYANKDCFGTKLADNYAQEVLRLYRLKLEVANQTTICDNLRNTLGC